MMQSIRLVMSLPILLLGLAFMWIALSICNVLEDEPAVEPGIGRPGNKPRVFLLPPMGVVDKLASKRDEGADK